MMKNVLIVLTSFLCVGGYDLFGDGDTKQTNEASKSHYDDVLSLYQQKLSALLKQEGLPDVSIQVAAKMREKFGKSSPDLLEDIVTSFSKDLGFSDEKKQRFQEILFESFKEPTALPLK